MTIAEESCFGDYFFFIAY